MFFSLIKDRLSNGYYRSQEQLLSDIDLISFNAKIYNGDEHDIAQNAKELCELLRVQLKKSMFVRSDQILNQNLLNAGKLTVPSRLRSSLQQKTLLDEMKNQINTGGSRRAAQIQIDDEEEVKNGILQEDRDAHGVARGNGQQLVENATQIDVVTLETP